MRLPRGIWYESERRRYRVRIYYKGKTLHLSYHKKLEEAEAALKQARAKKAELKREPIKPSVESHADKLALLRGDLVLE